jgi:hypothetical protein
MLPVGYFFVVVQFSFCSLCIEQLILVYWCLIDRSTSEFTTGVEQVHVTVCEICYADQGKGPGTIGTHMRPTYLSNFKLIQFIWTFYRWIYVLDFLSVIKLISFLLWFSRYSGFNMSHFPDNGHFLPKCHFHDEFKVWAHPNYKTKFSQKNSCSWINLS